jgi:hypothetical protein
MTLLPAVMTPGYSKFHTEVLVVPSIVLFGLMLTARMANPEWPQSVNALVAGAVAAAASYALYTVLPWDKELIVGKSVMLGLLHAEFSVFTRSHLLPSATTIAFFMFMFLYSLGDVTVDIKH